MLFLLFILAGASGQQLILSLLCETENGRTFTQSQKLWDWKRSLETIQSSSSVKGGHPEQVSQEHVQVSFEPLQRGRLHDLPGQPVPVLQQCQCREVLPGIEVEFLVLWLWPLLLILSLDKMENSLAPSSGYVP